MKKLFLVIISCFLLMVACEKPDKTKDTEVKSVIVKDKKTERGFKSTHYSITFQNGNTDTKFTLDASQSQYDFIQVDSKVNIRYSEGFKLTHIELAQ